MIHLLLARQETMAIMGAGTVSPDFATLGSVASLAAPERPNKKVDGPLPPRLNHSPADDAVQTLGDDIL